MPPFTLRNLNSIIFVQNLHILCYILFFYFFMLRYLLYFTFSFFSVFIRILSKNNNIFPISINQKPTTDHLYSLYMFFYSVNGVVTFFESPPRKRMCIQVIINVYLILDEKKRVRNNKYNKWYCFYKFLTELNYNSHFT